MKRKILTINEEKCNGCGQCIPNCPEGALQVIDGKVRLISDLFCDGLGACIGNCPEGAIFIEEREAEPYSEEKVMENIIKGGAAVIAAHLEHLTGHGEEKLYSEAISVLDRKGIPVPKKSEAAQSSHESHAGCPGSRHFAIERKGATPSASETSVSASSKVTSSERTPSELTQWPVQLHLINPAAPFFKGSDLLLAADCTAFALGSFHGDLLRGHKLAIACPKLDSNTDVYVEKLTTLIDNDGINTLTAVIMEVPCCGGLVMLAQEASKKASRKVPLKRIVIGINGDILKEEWL